MMKGGANTTKLYPFVFFVLLLRRKDTHLLYLLMRNFDYFIN